MSTIRYVSWERLQYFIAEDSCNIDIAYDLCTNHNQDTYDGTELHMDLFHNDIKAKGDYQVQQDCENSSGPASGQAQVIANPVDGYPLPTEYPQGTPLFDPVTKTCIGKALWTEYSNTSFADLYAHMQTGPAVVTPASTSNLAVAPSPSSQSPDLGSHVITFDPSMSSTTIQSQLDTIFSQQQNRPWSLTATMSFSTIYGSGAPITGVELAGRPTLQRMV